MSGNLVGTDGKVTIPLSNGARLVLRADEGIVRLESEGASFEVNLRNPIQSSTTLRAGSFSLTLVFDGSSSLSFQHLGVLQGRLSMDSDRNITSASIGLSASRFGVYTGADLSLVRYAPGQWSGNFRAGVQVPGAGDIPSWINTNLYREVSFNPHVDNPCDLLKAAGDGLASRACEILLAPEKRFGEIGQLGPGINPILEMASGLGISIGANAYGMIDATGNALLLTDSGCWGCTPEGLVLADAGLVRLLGDQVPVDLLPGYDFFEVRSTEFGHELRALRQDSEVSWMSSYNPAAGPSRRIDVTMGGSQLLMFGDPSVFSSYTVPSLFAPSNHATADGTLDPVSIAVDGQTVFESLLWHDASLDRTAALTEAALFGASIFSDSISSASWGSTLSEIGYFKSPEASDAAFDYAVQQVGQDLGMPVLQTTGAQTLQSLGVRVSVDGAGFLAAGSFAHSPHLVWGNYTPSAFDSLMALYEEAYDLGSPNPINPWRTPPSPAGGSMDSGLGTPSGQDLLHGFGRGGEANGFSQTAALVEAMAGFGVVSPDSQREVFRPAMWRGPEYAAALD